MAYMDGGEGGIRTPEELRRRVEARELKAAQAPEFSISRATLYEYLRAPA